MIGNVHEVLNLNQLILKVFLWSHQCFHPIPTVNLLGIDVGPPLVKLWQLEIPMDGARN